LNPETDHGKILFQSEEPMDYASDDGVIRFKTGTEKKSLNNSGWTSHITISSLHSTDADSIARF